MSRNHRKAGVIRIICTDSYHHDSAEFARTGYHYLVALHMAQRQDGSASPIWIGNGKVGGPMKSYRRPDGSWIFRFRCSCGEMSSGSKRS